MARQNPPREIDTSVELPKKRTESDETQALRALRELRKLTERAQAAHARHKEMIKAIDEEREALTVALSPSVMKLVDAMRTATNGGAQ